MWTVVDWWQLGVDGGRLVATEQMADWRRPQGGTIGTFTKSVKYFENILKTNVTNDFGRKKPSSVSEKRRNLKLQANILSLIIILLV